MADRELSVTGMHCAACVAAVEDRLKRVPGVEEARVSLDAGRAFVKTRDGVTDQALVEAVRSAGYDAAPAGLRTEDQERDEAEVRARQARRRMIVAWTFTVPI